MGDVDVAVLVNVSEQGFGQCGVAVGIAVHDFGGAFEGAFGAQFGAVALSERARPEGVRGHFAGHERAGLICEMEDGLGEAGDQPCADVFALAGHDEARLGEARPDHRFACTAGDAAGEGGQRDDGVL